MPRTLWAGLLLLVFASPVLAQQRPVDLRRDHQTVVAAGTEVESSGAVTPTPEMWFYQQQLKRVDDPKLAVREKAEARASARQQRIESLKWYGLSNSRPVVSNTPWWGGYSAYWGSNTYDTLRWRSAQAPIMLQR